MKSEQYKINLTKLCDLVNNVEGGVLEVGVFEGDDAEIICKYTSRKFIGIDTFTGYMPEDMIGANQRSKQNQKSKRWLTSIDEVRNRLKGLDVELYKGDSKVLLPELIKKGVVSKVALLYIDCNLYPPSLKAMIDTWDNIPSGGIVAIDEHMAGGETQAITELAKAKNLELRYFADVGPSYYVVKP